MKLICASGLISLTDLLTVAGWTQNGGLHIDSSGESCRFDSDRAILVIGVQAADKLIVYHSLGFEPHLKLSLERTHTHNHNVVLQQVLETKASTSVCCTELQTALLEGNAENLNFFLRVTRPHILSCM